MAQTVLLCLLLSFCILNGVNALISLQNGTQFYNIDTGAEVTDFNITSTLTKVIFNPACQISFLPQTTSLIFMIIWSEASQNGCKTLSQVISFTDQLFGNQPYVAVATSSFQNISDYSLHESRSESFGTLQRISKGFVTLVTNETAFELLSLPAGTLINVVSNPNQMQIFLRGQIWLGVRWFFFSLFAIFFIYGVVVLVMLRKEWRTLKFLCYLLNLITSTSQVIEVGVDPNYSTMLLTYIGWNLVYWVPFISYFVALQIVSLSWVKVTALTEVMSISMRKFMNGFFYFFIGFTISAITLIIAFSLTTNQQAYLVVLLIAFPIVLMELIALVYSGIRVLVVIKVNLVKSSIKVPLIRKNTFVLLLLSTSCTFILVVLAVYAIVESQPSYTLQDLTILTSVINIGFLLGMISSYYFYFQMPKRTGSSHSENVQRDVIEDSIPNLTPNPYSNSNHLNELALQENHQKELAHENMEMGFPDTLVD